MEQVEGWQLAFLGLTVAIATIISVGAALASQGKGKFLCEDCRFNNDEDCKKDERPRAIVCTAYRSSAETAKIADAGAGAE